MLHVASSGHRLIQDITSGSRGLPYSCVQMQDSEIHSDTVRQKVLLAGCLYTPTYARHLCSRHPSLLNPTPKSPVILDRTAPSVVWPEARSTGTCRSATLVPESHQRSNGCCWTSCSVSGLRSAWLSRPLARQPVFLIRPEKLTNSPDGFIPCPFSAICQKPRPPNSPKC